MAALELQTMPRFAPWSNNGRWFPAAAMPAIADGFFGWPVQRGAGKQPCQFDNALRLSHLGRYLVEFPKPGVRREADNRQIGLKAVIRLFLSGLDARILARDQSVSVD